MYSLFVILFSALLFSFTTAHSVFAQSEINGKIFDSEGPVIQANIAIKGTTRGTTTDEKGTFQIKGLQPGTYTLLVSAIGYRRLETQIEVSESKSSQVSLELTRLTFDLDQVVVTGSMAETSVSTSPVKVEVVNPKLFRMNPSNNVSEVLQSVNGLFNQVSCAICGTNSIRINGMEGPYTTFLIDGSPIMGSLASVYGLSGINPVIIDQIEIVRGPSSTAYGSEAMGGVVNVRTLNPKFSPRYSFDLNYSELNEKNIDFIFSPKLGNNRSIISGSLYHYNTFTDQNSDGFTDLPNATRFTIFNKWNIGNLTPVEWNANLKYFYENRLGGTEAYTNAIRGNNEIYGESIFTHRFEGSVTGTWRSSAIVKRFQASGSYHYQDSFYGDYGYEANQYNLFSNFSIDYVLSEKSVLQSGFNIRYEDLEQNFSENEDFDGRDQRFIPGLYFQAEHSPNKKLILLGGGRLDHYNQHGLIFSPRLSIRFNPFAGSTIRVNSGTGFRVINLFTEEHQVITGVRKIIVDDELKPERSRNISLNVNQLLNNGHLATTIDLDVYITRFLNQIIPIYTSIEGQNQIIYNNSNDYSVSRGVGLSVTQNFDFPLTLSLGGTFQDVFKRNENGEKEDIEFASSFLGVFNGSFTSEIKWRPSLDWTARFVGPMKLPEYEPPFERASESPWFSEHNMQLTIRPTRELDVYLSVKNIFNYTQKDPIIDSINPFGDSFDTSYVYGPILGRRILIGLRFRKV